MFDFSLTSILVASATSLWVSLSQGTAVAILGAVASAVLAKASRSPNARAVWLGLAVALGVSALTWQGAVTSGAGKMLVRDHLLALQAERERGDLAEADARAIAEQATQDLAEARADNARLKDLTDELSHDPRGAHPAVPRDLARRLRAL